MPFVYITTTLSESDIEPCHVTKLMSRLAAVMGKKEFTMVWVLNTECNMGQVCTRTLQVYQRNLGCFYY